MVRGVQGSDVRARLPMQQATAADLRVKPAMQHQSSELDGPPLPPRRAETDGPGSVGLMDEDDGKASSIPPLQPMRRL